MEELPLLAEKTMLAFIKDTNEVMDKSLKTMAGFLDLAKAIDTVSHHLLLIKLKNYGFRAIVLELLLNHVSNRVQGSTISQHVSQDSTV